MKTIKIADFTKYPVGRKKKPGVKSGEEFRTEYLVDPIKNGEKVFVDMDDTLGYGSSFLDEAFGGLLRPPHNFTIEQVMECIELTGPQEYVDEANQYIKEQSERNKK